MRRTRLSLVLVAIVLVASITPLHAQQPPPETPPDPPEKVIAGTGELTVTPKMVSQGETVTATFAPNGVNWTFSVPSDATCNGDFRIATPEEQVHLPVTHIGGPTSCSWKAGAPTGQWSEVSVGIVGPCGDPELVREGKAEFASCGQAIAKDSYYVARGKVISGTVRTSDHRPMDSVPISLSGDRKATFATRGTGFYYFFVPDGTYTVSAPAGLCVSGTGGAGKECETSKEVKVGGSQTVDFEPQRESAIAGTVRDSSGNPMPNVTVRVVGKLGKVLTTDGNGKYQAIVPDGTYTVIATKSVQDKTTDQHGNDVTTTHEQKFCASQTRPGAGQCVTNAQVTVAPDRTVNFTPQDDPGILVTLQGDVGQQSGFVNVRMTLTNPRNVALTQMSFGDARGMSWDSLQPNTQPSPTPIVTLVDGPTPAPPTGLAESTSYSIAYRFVGVEVGQAVLHVSVQATTTDRKVVKGVEEANLQVTDRTVKRDDLDRIAVDGITDALSAAYDGSYQIDGIAAGAFGGPTTIGTDPQASAGMVTAANELGIPSDMVGLLKMTASDQLDFWSTYGNRWVDNVGQAATSGTKGVIEMAHAISNPESWRSFGSALLDGIKALPGGTITNGGYLLDAIQRSETPDGIRAAIDANTAMLGQITDAAKKAVSDYQQRIAEAKARGRQDPIAFNREVATGWADAHFAVTKVATEAVAGEASGRLIVGAAGRVLSGLRTLSETGGVVDASAQTAAAADASGGGAVAAMTERTALAARAVDTIQELPYGTVLDDATLASKAGILPGDAQIIRDTISSAKADLGVDLEIVARPSEALSAGIDGVAKPEFIKPKAVSALDKLMGAEESFGGRASVYDPKPLPDDAVSALDDRYPGFRAKYQQRLDDQRNLFKSEWPTSDPAAPGFNQDAYNKSLRFLVDGSAKHEKGITVLVGRAGNPVPGGLRYLEQLDEADFVASRGLSPQQVADLRNQVTGLDSSGRRVGAGLPDQMKVKLTTETKNGTITFSDALQNKPIVSDLDLQAVRPVSGVWPNPPGRAKIEQYVMNKMKGLSRFPGHLWSDAAIDLPADYLEAAAKFELGTAHPDYARKAAESIAKRFATMARLADDQADKLIAHSADLIQKGDTQGASDLVAKAQDLRKKAEKFRQNTDPDALLKKWPPGEKTISFTAGGAQVSSGTGGR